MSLARRKSTTVSLTQDELVKLRDLYKTAWGSSYHPNKTVDKLEKALDRIDTQLQYAARKGMP